MPRCLAIVVICAWPAVAAAGPRMLVVLPEGQQTPNAEIERGVGPGARFLAREAFFRAVDDLSDRRHLVAARAAQTSGAKAVAELRRDEAQQALQTALLHFAAAQRLPEACAEAYATARDLTFLLWQRKQLDRARRWRAAAAGLADASIDPTRYQPAFVAFWQATDDNPRPVPVTLAVKGGAKGAPTTTRVNCRDMGAPPTATPIGGAALVQLSRPGRVVARVVAPTGSQLHELELPERPPASAEDTTALLRQLGAAELLWLRAEGDGWVADRFRPADGWRPTSQRIAAVHRPAIERPTPARRPHASAPQTDETRGRPITGWVLSATAVGALAAGIISAAVARSAADEIERKAASGSEIFDPADEQRNRIAKNTSYATFAVSGALAIAAAVYWVWWARRPPPPATAAFGLKGTRLVLNW